MDAAVAARVMTGHEHLSLEYYKNADAQRPSKAG